MSRKFALVIGVDDYEDTGLALLRTPSADVGALAETLRSPDIGEFDEVTQLVNEPSAVVRRAIAHFLAGKKRDDLLLLYFSGHGVLDDRGRLYLAAQDTERELLSGTAISADFIADEMDRSMSRRQVLILDCCHSGAFGRGAKGALGSSVGTASAFEGSGYGRTVLTATDSTQYAWEGEHVIGQAQNSVFTHYLIQGLRSGEADRNADGRITLDELYDYIYAQVVNVTPKQTPGKWTYSQQGEIVIAKNPSPAILTVELPSELEQAIESPFAGVREDAVRELDRLMRGSHKGLARAAQTALERLLDDDSRKVSAAASAVLAAYSETSQEKERDTRPGPDIAPTIEVQREPEEVSQPAPLGASALRETLQGKEADTGQEPDNVQGIESWHETEEVPQAAKPSESSPPTIEKQISRNGHETSMQVRGVNRAPNSGATRKTETTNALWIIFATCLILWLLGGFVFRVAGGLIHILLLIAVAILIYELMSQSNTDLSLRLMIGLQILNSIFGWILFNAIFGVYLGLSLWIFFTGSIQMVLGHQLNIMIRRHNFLFWKSIGPITFALGAIFAGLAFSLLLEILALRQLEPIAFFSGIIGFSTAVALSFWLQRGLASDED